MSIVVAGFAGANAPGAVAQETGRAAAAGESQSHGAWLKRGLIDAAGSPDPYIHEPYIYVLRRGGQSLNAREIYEHDQSEEMIRRLHDQGVEVFHTHLYMGFGMAEEMPEMENTKRAAAIAHRYGMKVDTYIQWNTMMYETFLAEGPRAKDWIRYDAFGRPIMLTFEYQQSFRFRPCFSNQDYLNYLKKIVHYAVEEVRTDFIHFDNFDLNPEPDSCHCQSCKTAFRKRLQTKYTPAQRRERFGFENIDYVNPPLWNRWNPPERMQTIFDPAFQEWVDHRCEEMASALQQIVSYITSLNPEVAIEINAGGITGANQTWTDGVDHSRLLKYTNAFWSEERDEPEYLPDGRLISTIRTYKLARTYQNIALTYISDSDAAIGECLAFNQTIGFAGGDPLPFRMVKHIAFYRKNRDHFVGSEDVAPVAVLRSYPSITYDNAHFQLSTILMEQALIQARIPFQLIFDEHIKRLSLSLAKVLILPNTECLSDAQLDSIRQFVEAGGGLIATEHTGLYDEWRRLRVTRGLAGLVEGESAVPDYEERVRAATLATGLPTRREVGSGRVVYFPRIEFDGPLPPSAPYFTIGRRFWKRPKNSAELIEAIRWAAKGNLLLEVTGPDFLIANLVEQRSQRRRLLHSVNYDTKQNPSIQGINVRCEVPHGQTAISVVVYSPDSDSPRSLDFHMQGPMVVFVIPELSTYSMIAISW